MSWRPPRARGLVDDPSRERGEATVEFIGLMIVVVIPVLYLILSLAQVQAAVLASEAASREAVRVLAEHPDADAVANAQIALIFEDFGITERPRVTIECDRCAGPDRNVSVTVECDVRLPLIPAWVTDRASIPIRSTSSSPIEGAGLQ